MAVTETNGPEGTTDATSARQLGHEGGNLPAAAHELQTPPIVGAKMMLAVKPAMVSTTAASTLSAKFRMWHRYSSLSK